MVIASSRVGKQMHKGEFRDNECGARGQFAAGELGETVSKMMANEGLQFCRKHRSIFYLSIFRRFMLLVGFLVLVFLGAKANAKGSLRNLDSFFCKVDQDGNGEFEQGEASKVNYLFFLCRLCFMLGFCNCLHMTLERLWCCWFKLCGSALFFLVLVRFVIS